MTDGRGVTTQDSVTSAADSGADERFVAYYAEESLSAKTLARFTGIMRNVLRARSLGGLPTEGLAVADIACNTGSQSFLWAAAGHRVSGLDISADLIDIGCKRAGERGLAVEFLQGDATSLPWASGSMDVCLLAELLEHVPAWEAVLSEACRVLRPGGALYVSTTNWLCPRQSEFDLPFYSWYPAPLKRRFEYLAVTTRPELVNFAKFPAVNWFSPYSLSRALRRQGFSSLDRFDLVEPGRHPPLMRVILALVRTVPGARFAGYMATPSTSLVAIRTG
ncbi:MAG: methyltransferase domain-containing protein [Gammaproteobacteria bacterium]